MSPYNILSDIKSGRIQVKSMDSATILFFKCRRWDYNVLMSKMQLKLGQSNKKSFQTYLAGSCIIF